MSIELLSQLAERLRSEKPEDEEVLRARWRQQQRCVLVALFNEGCSVREVRRTYPLLDWTLEELQTLYWTIAQRELPLTVTPSQAADR